MVRLSRSKTLFACAFVLIFAGGSALRLAEAGKLATFDAFKAASRDDYYGFGRNLRELGILGILGRPSAFRAVLYPAFLSAVETYRPDRRPRAPLAQAAISALTIPAAALAAGRLFGPGAALVAAAMTAFHPALSRSVPGARIEPLYGMLVLLVALALIGWARAPGRSGSALLGFAIAVSLLCRSVLFAFPLVLAAAARLRAPKIERGSLWVLVAASYAFLSPWLARNALQFQRFIPFEDRAAARNLLAGSLGWVENQNGAFQDRLADEEDPQGAFCADRGARMFSLALRRIAGDPGAYAASSLRRVFFLCRQHLWLLALLLVALYRSRGDPAPWAVGLLCAYFIGAHALLSVEPRYLEPLLPALICLAAGAFAWGKRSAPAYPRLIPAAVLLGAAPLYILCCGRLLAEARYTRFPCLLAGGAAASYHCAERSAAAGDWPRARAFYERALARLALKPGDALTLEAQVRVGLALTELHPGASAPLRRMPEALSVHPDDVLRKALALQDQGRLEEAIALFTALLERHPANASYLADRAVAYGLAGEDEKSAGDLRRSLSIAPANARASLNYGLWLEKRRRPREALRVYEAALAVEERRMDISPNETPFQYLAMMRARVRGLRAPGP